MVRGVWSEASSPGTLSNTKGRLTAVAYKDENTGDYGYTYYSYHVRGYDRREYTRIFREMIWMLNISDIIINQANQVIRMYYPVESIRPVYNLV